MKSFILVALAASASAQQNDATTNPLAKVIEMLTNIESEQKAALEKDQKTFSEYTNWCDDTAQSVKHAVESSENDINSLSASANEHNANADDLGKKIAVNNANIDRWTKDKKVAQTVRKEERAKYMADYTDLTESIAAVGAAMDTLRSENDKDEDGTNAMADGQTTYESQSGGIREIFEDLQTKFQDDLHGKDTIEQEAVAAYTSLMKLLDTKLDEENQMLEDNKESKADNEQKAAYAQGEADRLSAQVADDKKYGEETAAGCAADTSAFEQREQVAKDELAAIAAALEMLNNPDTATGAKNTFAQLRSSAKGPHDKAIAYLNQMSKKIGSTTLAAVAVSAKADVFGKVTTMIRELVARLEKEAAGDLEHHHWCLDNLAKNEVVRNKKTSEVESHATNKQRLLALIEKQSVLAQELTKEMNELDSQAAENTKIREQQKGDNNQVLAESKAALPLVQNAITVLREFYDNLGGASLVQTKSKADPSERKMAPAIVATAPAAAGAGGVVSLMEHVAEELSATITDTTVLEKKQSSDYDAFMKDNQETHHKKDLAEEQAQREKAQGEEDLTDCNTDIKDAQTQLKGAIDEFVGSLTPQCIKTQSDPQERIAKRKEEIAALEKALEILQDE